MNDLNALRTRAAALHLHGLTAHWSEVADATWVAPFLAWEEQERARRSLERRMQAAHIGRFSRSVISIGTGPSAAIAAPLRR